MKNWKKCLSVLVLTFMTIQSIGMNINVKANTGKKIQILEKNVKAKSTSNHEVSKMIDGDKGTYWQSIPSNGENDNYKRMYDHNRYIDIKLDGVYDLSQIKIYQNVDNSYNHYYIYTSTDGVNYSKVVSKTTDTTSTTDGDVFNIDTKASYVRLNMAYNSDRFVTQLNEIELYGTKISDKITDKNEIKVSNWEGSKWQIEWDKFESDQAYANKKVINEMNDLVGRVIGSKWKNSFVFKHRSNLNSKQDIFEIENGENGTIIIKGNNGLAMASGFNYYLKNYLNVDYNPLYESNIAVKAIKPVDKKIIKEAQFDLRYALNFCTYSYTMAFWNWDEYEKFLDWCAMNGINLVLDIVGQEEVLRQTLLEYGYTNEEIKDYISGPAYFAWFYMQNLYSIGGPLPNAWFEQRAELGRQIHDRMQTYGIKPVIQGFAGQVPETFAQKNKGAVLTPFDEWPSFTRPSIIKTYLTKEEVEAGKVNYFSQVANTFYEKQKNIFGDVSDYYATDPFHEGGNTGGLDIANIFKAVQDEMLKSNPDAIWVMQQWQGNLDANKMKYMDTSKALALDLQADMNPQHGLFEENGTPWIYCMLHNFGGRMGLDGEIPVIASDPMETKNKTKNMTGIGITPEALENSPVVYELLFDTTWSKDPIDYRNWLNKYTDRRAGVNENTNKQAVEDLHKAWEILLETAYADKGIYYQGAAETVINARPADGFNAASTWGHSTITYDKKKLDEALVLLMKHYDEFKNSPAYKYDLADVAEQVLCNAAVEYHKLMVQAKNQGDLDKFKEISSQFLQLIDLSDKILSTTDEYLVGTWIEASRKMIVNADDWTKDLFEFNARSLITTWGGERSGSLKDYSNRKWAGLTNGFYKERWNIWIRNRIAELSNKPKDPKDAKAESNWFMWEYNWVTRKSDDENGKYAYTTTPSNADLGVLAKQAYDKFSFTNFEKNVGEIVNDKENILKGKIATTTSTTASGNIESITNGTTSDEWIISGAGPHVIEFDLEGKYKLEEMTISFPQLAKQFPYTYKVETMNSDTNKWEVIKEDNSASLDANVSFKTTAVAEKIKITIKTNDLENTPVNITEVSAYGKVLEKEEFVNIAKGLVPTVNKPAEHPVTNITDGKYDTLWVGANGAYPQEITLPLNDETMVDIVKIHFEKPGLPFKFYVTAKENGKEVEIYNKYKDNQDVIQDKVISIPLSKSINEVKIYITGSSGKGQASGAWPALAEVELLTKGKLVNIAQGILPETNKTNTNPDNPLTNITDNNIDNLWKTTDWGDDAYPANVTIPLDQETYVDYVELYLEKPGLPFKFYVTGEQNGQDVELFNQYKEHNGTISERMFKIPVNKKIKNIAVHMTGITHKGEASVAGPAIAELKIFARESKDKTPSINFNEGKINNCSVSGANTSGNVIDGNYGTFNTVNKNEEVILNLNGNHYVKHVDLTFEKAELGLKYRVYTEDMNGNRTLISDKSKSNDLLENRTVKVPVNQIANKIIFVHMGNNGNGPAYAAESRLYEIEAFSGKPTSNSINAEINPKEASVLVDGKTDHTYSVKANDAIEVSLPNALDINLVSVEKENDEKILKYKAEYYDINSKEWKVLVDNNSNKKTENEIFGYSNNIVYAKNIRFTFKNEYKLKELRIYNVDCTAPLKDKISQIKNEINELKYDGTNNSYTIEAKEKLEKLLTEAEKALTQGLNSKSVEEWISKLDQGLKTFYNSGKVYIDRSNLLIALSDMDVTINKLKEYQLFEEADKLINVQKAARLVYEKYSATQTEIDNMTSKVNEEINSVLDLLNTADQLNIKLEIAENRLNDAVIGDLHGNYPQKAVDELSSKVKEIQNLISNATNEQLKQYIADIDKALDKFEKSVIVVDKTKLNEEIQFAEHITNESFSSYDANTWEIFSNCLKNAKEVFNKVAVSQHEVNEVTTKLKGALEQLKLLNRDVLSQYITEVSKYQEKDFTEKSWKKFIDAKKEAEEILNKDKVTQEALDKALKNLKQAVGKLEYKENETTPWLPLEPAKPIIKPTPITPAKPVQKPEKPNSDQVDNDNTPNTGVETNTVVLWSVLLGAGFIMLNFRKKKRKAQ